MLILWAKQMLLYLDSLCALSGEKITIFIGNTELISLKVGQKEIITDIRTIKDRLELKDEIYALKERMSLIEGVMGKSKS